MTRARDARRRAGLEVAEVAARVGRSVSYLRRCEKVGFPQVLAERLVSIYGCPVDHFLPEPRDGRSPGVGAGGAAAAGALVDRCVRGGCGHARRSHRWDRARCAIAGCRCSLFLEADPERQRFELCSRCFRLVDREDLVEVRGKGVCFECWRRPGVALDR